MRSLGLWLLIFAAASYVLPMFGMQLVILFWIYNWGPTVAMIIQVAMAALGVVLMVAGGRRGRGAGVPPAASA